MMPNSDALIPSPEDVADAVRRALDGTRLRDALRGTVTEKGAFALATRFVKETVRDLGRSYGFKVCASGSEMDDKEWLYDLCWYLDEPPLLKRLVLAMESEMKPGGSVQKAAAVDADFQKLLQVRADVRLWLCAIPNEQMAAEHLANCRQQIGVFTQTEGGDAYVFVTYVWSTDTTHVELFVS